MNPFVPVREGQLQSGQPNGKLGYNGDGRAEPWPEVRLSQDELSVLGHVLAMTGRQGRRQISKPARMIVSLTISTATLNDDNKIHSSTGPSDGTAHWPESQRAARAPGHCVL